LTLTLKKNFIIFASFVRAFSFFKVQSRAQFSSVERGGPLDFEEIDFEKKSSKSKSDFDFEKLKYLHALI